MRVAVDFTCALTQIAGIGRFIRGLVAGLVRCFPEDEFVLFYTARRELPLPLELRDWPNVRTLRIPVSEWLATVLWHRARLPLYPDAILAAAGLRADILHFPNFMVPPLAPWLRRRGAAVTIHDLSFYLFPEHTDPGLHRFLMRVVPRAVRQAELVLADSENTRQDLITHFGADPARTHAILGGLEPGFGPVTDPAQIAATLQGFGIDRPFILSVGTVQPRKNLKRLIQALHLLRHDHGLPHILVNAGRKGWLYDDIFATVQELQLERDVLFLEQVDDAALRALYTAASALAYPSLYEGFGIPPLEAMACGTPVVASNVSSIPEVVGDAGLLVDPLDHGALAAALARVLTDRALAHELRRRGFERARQFTWERQARKLMALYRGTTNSVA
jgi:glycosyltransferase involved in cell wall biosynthesis